MRVLIHSTVVCLFVLCASTTARVAGLSVTGTIKDSSGAVLTGATVELISNGKVVATVSTGSSGAFEFRNVTPRRYELRARLNGFKELRTRVLVIGTTSPAPLRLTMQPASVRERVEGKAATSVGPRSSVCCCVGRHSRGTRRGRRRHSSRRRIVAAIRMATAPSSSGCAIWRPRSILSARHHP